MPTNFFVLSSGAMDRAEAELQALHANVRVRNSMLMDHGGYVFLSLGVFPYLPPQDMGAIIAGAFASLNNLTQLTATSDLTVKFHGSPIGCLLFLPVTYRTMLAVNFDDETSDEKTIRQHSANVVAVLRPMIEQDETLKQEQGEELPFSSVQFIEERLNHLFDGL